jgi:hypothetical protein
MNDIQSRLFDLHSDIDIREVPLVFILGSPRTGSTLVYQILVNAFDFCYFSNFVNDKFAEHPVIGVALSLYLNQQAPVSYQSEYGKTQGDDGPSEGSLVFRNWFGGAHPSQTRSCEVLSDKKTHLLLTMKGIHKLTGRAILTKNAWNCFRIRALTELFPNIHFIWNRRDIGESAFSDLKARYVKGGSPTSWNSATTANYQTIQKRPHWEQVVEQQYEYNESIEHDLKRFCPEQYLELWYEDVCQETAGELERIRQFFESRLLPIRQQAGSIPPLKMSLVEETNDDYKRIIDYVASNHNRFYPYTYV